MPNIDYGPMTSVLYKELYPIVKDSLTRRENQYKANIADFMNKNHEAIYDISIYDNIYYTNTDKDKLFASLNITEKQVDSIMEGCYWYKKPINPNYVAEPYIETLMCAMIYFLKNKKQKEAEITLIYMAFSGKLFASLYGKYFNKVKPNKMRSTMDYVVNSMLNDKFNIKSEGSVFGAIRKICIQLIDTYKSKIIGTPTDEDYWYFLLQLRSRMNDFFRHLSNKFYEAYTNKNYLNFESDNIVDADEFRISDSDATMASRLTENAVNYMLSTVVDLKICNGFSDPNIKPTELKALMESILTDKANINNLYRVCNIIICDFLKRHHGKKVGDVEFLAYWFQAKPNTKDSYITEMQKIIESWLDNDANYRRRKSRPATAIAYRKAIVYYIVRIIDFVARR